MTASIEEPCKTHSLLTSATTRQLSKISVTALSGVGPKIQANLARMSIHSLEDLLFHFPLRYEDHSHVTCIRDAPFDYTVVIEGEVTDCRRSFKPKPRFECKIHDDSGSLDVVFFQANKFIEEKLRSQNKVRLIGRIRWGRHGKQLQHPPLKDLDGGQNAQATSYL